MNSQNYVKEALKAGDVVYYNKSGIAGIVETDKRPTKPGKLVNINPHYQPGKEGKAYPTFSERTALARTCPPETKGERESAEISRIAFSIAKRVESHFIRTRLSYSKRELRLFDQAEKRKNGEFSARGKRFIQTYSDKRKGLDATVSLDSIEEAALAARAVLIANWNERDASGNFPTVEKNGKTVCPIIRLACQQARKAFNRELEQSIEATPICGFIPEAVTTSPAREALKVYAKSIRSIRAYWLASESRKAKAALKSDLKLLRTIAQAALGQGRERAEQTASHRKALQRLRERLAQGELVKAFE